MIAFSSVGKQYGGQILFVDASFQINSGEKIGLVGPNGAGKSTLFRLILGEEQPDDGSIERPRRLSVGYFRQDVGDRRGRSVLAETIAGAGEVAELAAQLAELTAQLERGDGDLDAAVERFGEVQARYQDLGGYELEARAQTILAGLGFHPEQVGADIGTLSGGWKMRVALAQILLGNPELLLLDEPTNYLDLESILWLEGFLRDHRGTVVMTCHDKDILNRVVDKIVEIDGGEIRSYTGNYDFYEGARAEDAARREAAYARQQAMLAKESQFIERFKAQAAKAAQVQSRIKKLDKIEKVEPPRRLIERTFEFRAPTRSGDDVIRLEGIAKAFGDRVVHRGVTMTVRRGERWAIMGENGAGKSTLLKMMAGVLTPDAGVATVGAAVSLGYYAQHTMDGLTGDRSVLEELEAHAPLANQGTLRNLAGAFGFHDDDVFKPVRVLSGGERARVALAKILYDAPNLMILDEPTNHLDIVTKRALMRALVEYQGTLVFVSHDRPFLRALATRVLELGGGGNHRVYGGNYDEYVASTGREAPGMRQL
ncbi:MAG: ABC-F family ATP-binding cassette domain-containing protein [Kofleriaceae bacterium]|nr:ABC-F family ATP-binding cassette domain-containing protein [Kofleriaceae bacterium]MBP6837939.1 ABC-F family ATP-binding cassette domain-containing protein [Kofleriaceae bacterium]MBP9204128.1 ABC-F family ATP-binding cassette domain-containing protein [Kofleriaceae bacterium]